MITFTYKDYLKYANIGMFCVEEESAEYKLNTTKEELKEAIDKIMKRCLTTEENQYKKEKELERNVVKKLE